jgi:hypothetical protein
MSICFGERGVMMEGNEEDDDETYPMYPEYGDTTTGHAEDEEVGEAKDKEAADEPADVLMIFVGPSLMHTQGDENDEEPSSTRKKT